MDAFGGYEGLRGKASRNMVREGEPFLAKGIQQITYDLIYIYKYMKKVKKNIILIILILFSAMLCLFTSEPHACEGLINISYDSMDNCIPLSECRDSIIHRLAELSQTESAAVVEEKRTLLTKRLLVNNLRTQITQGAPAELINYSIEGIRAFKSGDLVGLERALDNQADTPPIYFFDGKVPYYLSEEFLFDLNDSSAF